MTSADMVDFLSHNTVLEHENPLPLTFLECGGFTWGHSSLAHIKMCDITVRPAVVQQTKPKYLPNNSVHLSPLTSIRAIWAVVIRQ